MTTRTPCFIVKLLSSTKGKQAQVIPAKALCQADIVLRYLHVRLLLLRPVLSNFITSDFHDGERSVPLGSLLSYRISLQCAIVCVKVAQEAIDTIYRGKAANAGDVGHLSAWWFNVLFLYSSATVLIAARLSPSVRADVSEESILDSWRKAVEVLDEYGVFGSSIPHLTTTLRLLFDAVPQQYSRLKQNPRQVEADTAPLTHTQANGAVPLAILASNEPGPAFFIAYLRARERFHL